MCDIKYCKDCKYSILSGGVGKVLRCVHPKIIKTNITPNSVSNLHEVHGKLCSEVREGYWFVKYKIKGKLWESKYSTEEFMKTFKR